MKYILIPLTLLFITSHSLDETILFENHIFKMPEDPMEYFDKYFSDEDQIIFKDEFEQGVLDLYQANAEREVDAHMYHEIAEEFAKNSD